MSTDTRMCFCGGCSSCMIWRAKDETEAVKAENAKLRAQSKVDLELCRSISEARDVLGAELDKREQTIKLLHAECNLNIDKRKAVELQVDAMRPVVEAAKEYFKIHYWDQGYVGCNIPHVHKLDMALEAYEKSRTEKRKDDVMIGKVELQGYFPPSMIHKRIVHCGGIGCGKMCTCQCEDCVAIRNF